MGKLLAKYRGLVAEEILNSIKVLARDLHGRSILHVTSGRQRPDILEMLRRLQAYFEDAGVQFRATTIAGTEEYFDVARLIEGRPNPEKPSPKWERYYEDAIRENAARTFLSSDLVVIHGVQPMGLVHYRVDDKPWLWRCHADLSEVNGPLRSFVNRYVTRFQGTLFSHTKFIPDLGIPHFIVPPSVDAFSPVNREMSSEERSRVLEELGVPPDAPMALFLLNSGSATEALEAIRAWKGSRVPGNALLVLLALGTPEGAATASERDALRTLDRRVRILSLPRGSTRELCALGWSAQIVVEASASHWPDLDLLSVMWKGKPAVAVGGSATSRFVPPEAGVCVGSLEELSGCLGELLQDADRARVMGAEARTAIARRHLMPRHLLDYLKLMLYVDGGAHGE